MSLIGGADLALRVAAQIEHGGEGLGDLRRAVEIAGDVSAGAGLEVELLDDIVAAVEGAGDGGRNGRAVGQRPQAQHLQPHLAAAG